MIHVEDGQCGLCAHFGEHHETDQTLVQIRVQHEAPEDILEECGHPTLENLRLKVTPHSGCDGFTPAAAA